jgi:hypothetical protein
LPQEYVNAIEFCFFALSIVASKSNSHVPTMIQVNNVQLGEAKRQVESGELLKYKSLV